MADPTPADARRIAEGEALKPCPFCGGEPFFRPGIVIQWVQCRESNDCTVHPTTCAETKAGAYRAWNTRRAALEEGRGS